MVVPPSCGACARLRPFLFHFVRPTRVQPAPGSTFTQPSGIGPHGDFNGDGREDILASVYNASTTKYDELLYLSTADGTYDAPKTRARQCSGDWRL